MGHTHEESWARQWHWPVWWLHDKCVCHLCTKRPKGTDASVALLVWSGTGYSMYLCSAMCILNLGLPEIRFLELRYSICIWSAYGE